MHNLTSRYTKYFNGKYERSGHLFKSRFKAAVVEKKSYLSEVLNYIHHNPFRFKTISKPKEYPYSSCHLYQPSDKVNIFRIDLKEEREEVGSYFFYLPHEQLLTKLHKSLQKKKMLGGQDFIKKIKENIKEKQFSSREDTRKEERKFVFSGVGAITGIILAGFLAIGSFSYYSFNLVEKSFSLPLASQPKTAAVKESYSEEGDYKGLEGAEFLLEVVRINSAGEKQLVRRDKIMFRDGKFYSQELNNKGFKPSNYTLTRKENGTVVWETMQSTKEGTTISWYGEWNGKVVRGILSQHNSAGKRVDLSFLSKSYSYKGDS